jgi:hypothetical protein
VLVVFWGGFGWLAYTLFFKDSPHQPNAPQVVVQDSESVLPAKPFVPTGELEEKTFGDYTIRIYVNGGEYQSDGYLEILNHGTRVYTGEKERSFEIEENVPIGADVTGLGVPDLVVKESTGGVHCCTSFDVFEIGSNFRKVSTLETGGCDGAKLDIPWPLSVIVFGEADVFGVPRVLSLHFILNIIAKLLRIHAGRIDPVNWIGACIQVRMERLRL